MSKTRKKKENTIRKQKGFDMRIILLALIIGACAFYKQCRIYIFLDMYMNIYIYISICNTAIVVSQQQQQPRAPISQYNSPPSLLEPAPPSTAVVDPPPPAPPSIFTPVQPVIEGPSGDASTKYRITHVDGRPWRQNTDKINPGVVVVYVHRIGQRRPPPSSHRRFGEFCAAYAAVVRR